MLRLTASEQSFTNLYEIAERHMSSSGSVWLTDHVTWIPPHPLYGFDVILPAVCEKNRFSFIRPQPAENNI